MSGSSHGTGGDPATDPSMEDILASIRRILSEDDVPPVSGGGEAHPTAGGTAGDDGVLVLDEAMMVEPPPYSGHFPSVLVPPAAPIAEPPKQTSSAESAAPPVIMPQPGAMTPAPAMNGLLAPEAEAAAASSVGSLLRTLSTERSSAVYKSGPTIEDLVREEMRPLLKAWLDQHLAPMVERLVRVEIERVTGRAET